jgi:hypothetical protein
MFKVLSALLPAIFFNQSVVTFFFLSILSSFRLAVISPLLDLRAGLAVDTGSAAEGAHSVTAGSALEKTIARSKLERNVRSTNGCTRQATAIIYLKVGRNKIY